MARWLVTDGDRQFSARDIEELEELARRGEISAGSMIQPPGASDWLYATEVPELKGWVRSRPSSVDDDDDCSCDGSGRPRGPGGAALLGLLALQLIRRRR